jgi:hypothetical protein
MSKKPHFQSHTRPADMHSDGVYFNEDLKAKKEAKDQTEQQLKNEKTKNSDALRNNSTNKDHNDLTHDEQSKA